MQKNPIKHPQKRRHFSYLLPENQQWFSPKEVAEILGRTPQYVRNAFESQQLMGHAISVHAKTAMRKRYQITREALLLFLLETSNYEPEDFLKRLGSLLTRLDRKELNALQEQICELLQ